MRFVQRGSHVGGPKTPGLARLLTTNQKPLPKAAETPAPPENTPVVWQGSVVDALDANIQVLKGTASEAADGAEDGANLLNPCGLVVSTSGVIYIADTGHHRICVLKNDVLQVLAGSGAKGYADGIGLAASFAHPCGVAIDSEGAVYVADCGNHCIRKVADDGTVTTIAGSGTAGHRDGRGRAALFCSPCGIAIDENDVLYVADYSNNCVRVVAQGGVVATLHSLAEKAAIESPYGIAVRLETTDSGIRAPWIYVSSYHSNSIAAVSPDGRVLVLAPGLAPGAASKHADDGVGAEAVFHSPNGLAMDADGELYVADSGNHRVARVSLDGSVSTVAGTGQPALSDSQFNSPAAVCVCILPQLGPVLLVADRANSCVRILPIDALPPPRVAPSTLRKDLRMLLEGSEESVVEGEAVFEVEGRTLRAPKAVLCVRCAHFRAMFTSGMRECFEARVCVPDVAYSVFRALLGYLLTDEVSENLSADEALELMMLSNLYGMLRLEQLCEQLVALRLRKQNVHEVNRCAEIIGAYQLQRATARILKRGAATEWAGRP